MALSAEDLKKICCSVIDEAAPDLHQISSYLWDNPELAYQEEKAHAKLTEFLQGKNFNVEKHYLLNTGFRAVSDFGRGPNICVCCEYDALPEIGHACGHNLIAEAGIGASLGIRAALSAAREANMEMGKLTVLGTPAEEGGGGKIDMIDLGAFKDITCAMMVHPCQSNIQTFPTFARERFQVRFHGHASHAAAAPWQGVNALDALFVAYGSISCLRQQLKPNWQIHGVITNGGERPNVIPELTEMDYYIRTSKIRDLKTLKAKAVSCFEGAGIATGCKVEIISSGKPYADVNTNWTIANIFTEHAEGMGVVFNKDKTFLNTPYASTDMGNVSYEIPTIHPMYHINTQHANHTREFAEATGSADAQPYTIIQAKAMAMTAIDLYCNPSILKEAENEFNQSMLGGGT